jgi:hypothetical protein
MSTKIIMRRSTPVQKAPNPLPTNTLATGHVSTGAGFLAMVVLTALFIGGFWLYYAAQPDAAVAKSFGANVTIPTLQPYDYDKFSQIESGMTYEQCCAIMGGPGRIFVESSIDMPLANGTMGKLTTVIYSWVNPGGSNLNVTVQSGRVTSKAQLGLR